MARPRESFFSLPALALMGALIALALYLLFPRQAVFEDPEYLDNPDALSIAYLEILLRSDSDNVPLRLSLAKALQATGQPDRAEAALAPLMAQTSVIEEAFERHLRLKAQQMFAAPEGPERQALRDELFASTQKLLSQPYPPDQLLALLSPLGDWLSPSRYLALLQGAQDRMDTPEQRLALARDVAQLQEGLSRPGAAAATLRPHIGTVRPADRPVFIDNLIRLELASGDPDAALALFKRRQLARNMSEDELDRGIQLARLANSSEDAAAWIRQRADNNPNNLEYQRELLGVQLASGRPQAALTVVRRLQRQPGQLTTADRETVAQILEWNDLPAEALPVWASLYQETGSSLAYNRATNLARGLFQWDTLRSLLTLAAERRTLSADGYLALADAQIQAGQIEAAKATLAMGRSRFPSADPLTDQLVALHVNLREFPAAIDLLRSQNRLSDRQRLELATLLWRTRQPEAALAVLDTPMTSPELVSEAETLRIDLALYLGRRDILQSEYRRMLAMPDAERDALTDQRMLDLAVLFDDYPVALRLSEKRYQQSGEPRYLIAMAEYQLALEDWDALEKTLNQWQQQIPAHRQNLRYWSIRALAHQRNGDIRAADDAFRTAWQLAPDDENLLINWAWLTLAQAEEYADRLQALLARLETSPSPEAYPVLAYGYSVLGQPDQSLRWFREGMASRADDLDWLLGAASIMEQTDQPGTASDLRQMAAKRLDEAPSSRRQLAREDASDAQYWQMESRPEVIDRYLRQINRLDTPMAGNQRQELTRDTVNLHQTLNRAVQVESRWQNLGNFTVRRTGVNSQFSHDELRWQASAHTLSADGAGRLNDRPERSTETSIGVDRRDGRSVWSLTASQLPRYNTDDLALSGRYDYQWSDRIYVGAGVDFQQRTPDSAEAWWLTRRNRVAISAGYTPFSRLNLNAQVEQLTIDSLDDEQMASGQGLDLNATYTLFRNDPAWIVSAGYRRQQLSLNDQLPVETQQALDQPLAPSSLLTEDYERIGIGSRWFHGEPHALYRTTPSPRAFFGLNAGYVLSTSSAEVGVDLGLGWRVLGDDELALSSRWSSEGLDGNGRTEFNLTYTIYLGR